jgi:amino acid adenylation domain-containing protein
MVTTSIKGFRCSPQQSHLWNLFRRNRSFVASCEILIEGHVDKFVLRRAIEDVVARHAILRTAFYQAGELRSPLQVIAENGRVEWKETDFSALCGEPQEQAVREWLAGERNREFDLTQLPLIRASFLILGGNRALLFMMLPALCADSITLNRLFQEIVQCCQPENKQGQQSDYVQYLQVSEWLNDLIQESGPVVRDLPKDIPLNIPGRLPSSGLAAFSPQVLKFSTNPSLQMNFELLQQQYSIRPEVFWLAVWQVLLCRMSSEKTIVIAYGCGGRNYEELRDVFGPCFRYVPILAQLGEEHRFKELLAVVSRAVEEAESLDESFYWNEDLGNPEAFYSVAFEFQNWPGTQERDQASFSLRSKFVCSDRFLLKASPIMTEDGLFLELHYDCNSMSQPAVQGLGRCFLALAEAAMQNPDDSIFRLAMLSQAERNHLLVDFNQTNTAISSSLLVHELIAQQADRTPDAPALECGSRILTFQELNFRSNQLARFLQNHGIGPEQRVAILMEHSPELIVSLLGILKSGGIYVPLSVADPPERLAFILSDARPALILVNHTSERLPKVTATVVDVAADWQTISASEPCVVPPNVSPENGAYTIYTSGSTGVPKGVVITHLGLLNYLLWCVEEYKVSEGDGAPLHSPISVDLSVTSIFAPLMAGRKIMILPETLGPEALTTVLKTSQNLSFIKLTPSHLDILRDELERELAGSPVRVVIVGGEALLPESIRPWQKYLPQTRFINEYGPTETVVGCCTSEVNGDLAGDGPIPIGRPIANTQLYILDSSDEVVPAGAIGELYIGGTGVARGYLNRFDLTAEKFVPDPFSITPGSRLYRTGDLARYGWNGDIEYLGRADSQVKIHGHRVELGEIEAALRQHDGIAEAAVVVQGDKSLEKQVIAYFVPRQRPGPASRELRQFLLIRLPDHMVPARFVALDRLPLTSSGKVDRRALPSLDTIPSSRDIPYAPPQTMNEEVLATIWSEVLGIDDVGIDDSFFTLGGDSIRAIQVRARAQKRGLQISQQQIFEYQTIRTLTHRIASQGPEAGEHSPVLPFQMISEEDAGKIPDGIEDAYPLTMLQTGMLFHSELDPESPVYHDLHSFHLKVPFDEVRFRMAVEELTEQNEVLRTSFDLKSYSQPLQLVHRRLDPKIRILDFRRLSGETLEQALSASFESEKNLRFTPENAPLVRFVVQRRTDATIEFIMCFHHSILDGWSAATLMSSLFNRYSALLQLKSPPALPGLAVAFRDFVAEERKALSSPDQRLYWEKALDEITPVKLPRRVAEEGSSGPGVACTYPIPISEEASTRLYKVARLLSVPLKSVLLAVHIRVMRFLTSRRNVVTGMVANGRLAVSDGDRALGLFLNMLPLSLSSVAGSWRQLIEQVFKAERQMMEFRRYPLAELQRKKGEQLFETAFNFMHYHVYKNVERLSDAEMLGYTGYEQTNLPFIANFSVAPGSLQISLHFNYLPAEFPQDQIALFAEYYQRCLTSIAADPEQSYTASPMLSEREQQHLLELAQGNHVPYDTGETIAELFNRQVQRSADAIALVCGTLKWTYRELDQRANQIARFLHKRGIKAETVVGIAIARQPEFIAVLVGIMKAGGAYLPLDTGYPPERLKYMLACSGAQFVVVQQSEQQKLQAAGLLDQINIINLDEQRQTILQESVETALYRLHGDNLAHVIYTSGSTGQPKGVAITQRNVIRLVHNAAYARLTPDDVFVQLAPLFFDASTLEMWGSLVNGARLVIPPPQALSLHELEELLRQYQVTILWLTAGLFHRVVEESPEILKPIRQFLSGGDVLSPVAVGKVLEHLPECQMINGYGPTETTTFASTYNARLAAWRGGSKVPIGRPISNTQVYVVNDDIELVPEGVAGELWIGGDGLARGYLAQPDMTAASFMPDCFSGIEGGRLYRTGDLVRFLPDGNLEFLARTDDQVKIRGYRIELKEIEAALLRQQEIQQAVVIVQKNDRGDERLVAYITVREPSDDLPARLREALRRDLPEYTIPTTFVQLAKMPLIANGKIDRKALPAPAEATMQPEHAYIAPRTATEKTLAELWTTVLKLHRVGVTDNFFYIGGHSLLAIQLISRIRAELGIELPLRDLFEYPTVAEVAEHVDRLLAKSDRDGGFVRTIPRRGTSQSSGRPVKEIETLFLELEQLSDNQIQHLLDAHDMTKEELAAFPLSYSQEQVWNKEKSGSTALTLPVALRLEGSLNVAVLERSLNEIICRHEALRTVLIDTGSLPNQAISNAIRIEKIPILNLSDLTFADAAAAIKEIAIREAREAFDLFHGPLFRVQLLRLSEPQHIAFLTLHLIIADAWSVNLMLREMSLLYTAFSGGLPSPLPELPIQLADYAVWERQRIESEEFLPEIDYWVSRFAKDVSVLELPTDRPWSPDLPLEGDSISVLLPLELIEKARAFCGENEVTMLMLMVAAFYVLLFEYTGQTDLIVGVPETGRSRPETESLIGSFANTLVLRVNTSGEQSFKQLLMSVRKTLLDAFAHKDMPYAKLLSLVLREKMPQEKDLFRVMIDFVPQDRTFAGLTLPDMQVSVLDPQPEALTVGNDLTFVLREQDSGLDAAMLFKRALFDSSTIAAMLERFQQVLERVLNDPKASLEQVKENAAEIRGREKEPELRYGVFSH